MGLFDGGFDMDALMNMINPAGSAQAAEGWAGNPTGGITPEQLLQSNAAQNPVVPPQLPPQITRGVSGPDTTPPAPTFNDTSGLPPQRTFGSTFGGPPPPMGNGAGAPLSFAPQGGDSATSVGEALTGTPSSAAPLPQGPTPSGKTLDEASQGGGGTPEAKRPSLAEALKGVKAPAPPVLQKISTPNAPRPTGQIKGGDLQALLMALNAGVPALAGRQLPVTLGGGRG